MANLSKIDYTRNGIVRRNARPHVVNHLKTGVRAEIHQITTYDDPESINHDFTDNKTGDTWRINTGKKILVNLNTGRLVSLNTPIKYESQKHWLASIIDIDWLLLDILLYPSCYCDRCGAFDAKGTYDMLCPKCEEIVSREHMYQSRRWGDIITVI